MTYRWTYELTPSLMTETDPEWWARRTFEGLPRVVRGGLLAGWRFGLRLRLRNDLGADGILGWHVTREPGSVTMTASGPLVSALNTVHVADGTVRWTTVVEPKNVVGRVFWAGAGRVHQLTLPLMLKRAAR